MTDSLYRVFRPSNDDRAKNTEDLLSKEWLVTNGLGGYAASTLGSLNTRHYHGLLISAEAPILGRIMMLNHLVERIRLADGRMITFSGAEPKAGEFDLPAARYLSEFRLEDGLPIWRYNIEGYEFERSIVMPHKQNTIYIRFHALSDGAATIELEPQVWLRVAKNDHSAATTQEKYHFSADNGRYEVSSDAGFPPLRLALHGKGARFTSHGGAHHPAFFRVDKERGTYPHASWWTPGSFSMTLGQGHETALVASSEPWSAIEAVLPAAVVTLERKRRKYLVSQAAPALRTGPAAELVLAADQFVVAPVCRVQEELEAATTNDSVRAIFAGYYWFADWGRDALISLEGLALVTGRGEEAGQILRTKARYVQKGLIPNFIPENGREGHYNTADATLWFFHALDRYLVHTNDTKTLEQLLPVLASMARQYLEGTQFNIKVDPADHLLSQGIEGDHLTWMDAKCGDWIVTPRRGKAVELNALWYNALRLLAQWMKDRGDEKNAGHWDAETDQLQTSFNRRFWYEEGGYLYDVVDSEDKSGNDSSLRPNQLFSFSLRHAILDRDKWQPVMDKVREELLTPVGLRSLAPSDPNYKPFYRGDKKSRDGAYHQGTVWPWLIGPYIDAYLKLNPDGKAGGRALLEGLHASLQEAAIGSLSEIADGDAPHTSRGCIAQAWSVAEFLRCWARTGD